MLPEKRSKKSGQSDKVKVETGSSFLRETLATTNKALRDVADENKKLKQKEKKLSKELRKKKKLVIGSNIALSIGVIWFTYTTILYYQQQSTPITHLIEQPKTQSLPLLEVKKIITKPVKPKTALKTPGKSLKKALKKDKKKAFSENL